MDATQICKLAKELIDRENKIGWGYELGVPEVYEGSVWRVFVRWIPSDGDTFEGSGIIHVNVETCEAWFIEGPFPSSATDQNGVQRIYTRWADRLRPVKSQSWKRRTKIDTTQIVKLAKELIDRGNNTDWDYELGPPELYEGTVWTLGIRWIPSDGSIVDGGGSICVDAEKGEAWFDGGP